MYCILLKREDRGEFGSLFQFMTTVTDKEQKLVSFESDEELDEFVEKMINEDGYAKSDFVIVSVKDFHLTSDIFDQDKGKE